jgi:hypothetical protein
MRISLRSLVFVVACGAMTSGCRRDVEHTIVVRHAPPSGDAAAYDAGEAREPDRIDVVVAGPRGAAAASPLSSLIGQRCKVQFRRDALGLAAAAPVPPTGQGPGGRAVSIEGTIRSVTGAWIVLERDGRTYWVAQSAVLLIEVADQLPTTSPTVE